MYSVIEKSKNTIGVKECETKNETIEHLVLGCSMLATTGNYNPPQRNRVNEYMPAHI